jgi:maleamate amidohydrolase
MELSVLDERDWERGRAFNGRVGFGARAAVVVVDVTRGFTSPQSPLGTDVPSVIEAIGRLIAASRAVGAPVIYTAPSYGDDGPATAPFFAKIPGNAHLRRGSEWELVDERVAPVAGEPVLRKLWPSAFFATPLASILVGAQVDTVVMTGLSTSGCVRASVVDGLQFGYRVIVPREAVGDRNPSAHVASLLDIDAKYGDVMSVDEVDAQIRSARG